MCNNVVCTKWTHVFLHDVSLVYSTWGQRTTQGMGGNIWSRPRPNTASQDFSGLQASPALSCLVSSRTKICPASRLCFSSRNPWSFRPQSGLTPDQNQAQRPTRPRGRELRPDTYQCWEHPGALVPTCRGQCVVRQHLRPVRGRPPIAQAAAWMDVANVQALMASVVWRTSGSTGAY